MYKILDEPDFTSFLTVVIDRQPCGFHNAVVGQACFDIHSGISSRVHRGVCDVRAKSSGFVGQISQQSLIRNYNRKR